jgi:hypothetical protein
MKEAALRKMIEETDGNDDVTSGDSVFVEVIGKRGSKRRAIVGSSDDEDEVEQKVTLYDLKFLLIYISCLRY